MKRLDAVAKNLLDLKEDEAILSGCRSAHLREAAYLICMNSTLGSIASDFDSLRERYVSMRDSLDMIGAFNLTDRITLCTHIANTLGAELSVNLLTKYYLQAEDRPKAPVICYLRNPISDLAYTEFVRDIPNASVLYADSFQSVCENLIGGESDYAILPIVSGSDGRLSRFEAMISSNGFVVSAVASVTPDPDISSDRFALLSRAPEVPQKPDRHEILCLKLSIPSTGNPTALMTAAHDCGAILLESGTTYLDSRKSFSFVFDITESRLAAFLAYLTLEESGFVTNGLFITQKTPD